ncbi:MAG: cellulase family glycosylhydrolase, partial [Desulfobacteraceae bacterium]
RVVLGNGEQWGPTPAEEVADIIAQLKELKMLAVLEVHDCTGYPEKSEAAPLSTATDYWLSIKDVLIGEEDYVIINIANEPFGNNVESSVWSNEHIEAINRLRNGGLNHCLMVDAANWGQDWEEIMLQNAPNVFTADPLKNIVFSIHMYQIYNNRSIIDNYLSTFVNEHKLPLVVGEFGADHAGEDVDEESILELANYYHIGYLGWSWSGNSGGVESLDITLNFNLETLSPWGDFLINSTYGIRNTSQLASVYTGGVSGIFPPSAASQSVTVNENDSVTITLSGSDLDGEIVAYEITQQPQNGSLSGSGANLVYTPDSGFTGSDAFQFTVTDDDEAASNPATVNISVVSSGGVNGKPACEVDYNVQNDWGAGAHINVTIINNMAEAINGWEMSWLLGDSETFSSGWNVDFSTSGDMVTASADETLWNGVIKGNGGMVTFGMQITKDTGSVHQPDAFTLNDLTCAGGTGGSSTSTVDTKEEPATTANTNSTTDSETATYSETETTAENEIETETSTDAETNTGSSLPGCGETESWWY